MKNWQLPRMIPLLTRDELTALHAREFVVSFGCVEFTLTISKIHKKSSLKALAKLLGIFGRGVAPVFKSKLFGFREFKD